MIEEILLRRQEEIAALASFYGEDFVPSLEEGFGNNTVIPPEGPWFIKLISAAECPCTVNDGKGVPILEIRLPSNYPFSGGDNSGLPEPMLHNTISYNFSSERKELLVEELLELWEPDMDMGVAIMWAERCRQEFLEFGPQSAVEANNQTNKSLQSAEHSSDHQLEQDQQQSGEFSTMGKLCIKFLTYNHLIYGKSHKKEAQLISCAAKMGLSGFVVYGTPGIVGLLVCYGFNDAKESNGSYGVRTLDCDVAAFVKECGRIGKRATLLDLMVELTPNGLHPSCLGVDDNKIDTNCTGKEGTKQPTQSKRHGFSKKGEKNVSNGQGFKNLNSNQNGIGALLFELLGPEKTNFGVDANTVTVSKAGLKSFDSVGNLKQVLTSCGLDERFFQQILGLA
ncbi:hypothetical protein ACHAXS_005964 [Conticribra weissflogii]